MASNAETFAVKLNYDGQMRRFPITKGTTYSELREQVVALLALRKDTDIVLKYSDEEGDLITISSDLELNSALTPGSLLRLVVAERTTPGYVGYPSLDAPMLEAVQPTAPPPHAAEVFRAFADGCGHPGMGGHPHPPPPGFGPHDHPSHGYPHRGGGFHRGGPHRGGHHHQRGAFFGPRGGFHGAGPYAHPWSARRNELTPEQWQDIKEQRKNMKKEWKDSLKHMRKECKEGRGGWGRMGWANAECANERFIARFAKDVSIPDGTQLAPNTPFVKTWRLRNEGAEWPANCVLRFLGKKSDNMGGPETVPIVGPIAPNAEVDVSVTLVAPEKPGRYTGYWKMCTPEGRKFGQRVWVSIVVPGVSSSSSSDSDKEADKYEALVDAVLATGITAKRHRVFRMLQKTKGDVNRVCEILAHKEEKKARKAMKKQMKL